MNSPCLPDTHFIRAVGSLRAMVKEMNRKKLDVNRITKTAYILVSIGISTNSIPQEVTTRCLDEQHEDGGWVSVVDTMWNVSFLKILGQDKYGSHVAKGIEFLRKQANGDDLWGRSARDRSRIPVTGMMMFLLPELATKERLSNLEALWISEQNSLTYKAAYTLMCFRRCRYTPQQRDLIEQTVAWLSANQRPDGSYAPWKDHPVPSDIFCTSVSSFGLLQYPHLVSFSCFRSALEWIRQTQLPQGIWPFHEIEDGASWGIWALSELAKFVAQTGVRN